MRSNERPHQGKQLGFEDDADESLWAMRDYFWAVGTGILDDPGRDTWSSFSAGYAHYGRRAMESDHPPGHPGQRAA